MVRGDDKSLVFQPQIAYVQVILVFVAYKDVDAQGIFYAHATTVDTLFYGVIRVEADFRDNYSPTWKHSHPEW